MEKLQVVSAESVAEGHPDKVADIIADSILDEFLSHDAFARVACEVLVGKEAVIVAGEFTSGFKPDFDSIVRQTLRQIGYTSSEIGIAADSCRVIVSASEQSEHLRRAMLPSNPKGRRLRLKTDGKSLRAGDQAVVVGFAADNPFGGIPPEAYFAKRLAAALDSRRHSRSIPYLWPDGKTMVSLLVRESVPIKANTIVVSAQHDPSISLRRLRRDLIEGVVLEAIPATLIAGDTKIVVNPPDGRFSFGGPAADTGVTGRKLIADAYGPSVGHGGGALSGKDATKIDRCGAYLCRHVARTLVARGLAEECRIQLSYILGQSTPIAVNVTGTLCKGVKKHHHSKVISEMFDLRPGAAIERLALRKPLFARATRVRHFGIDPTLPWEIPAK